MTVKVYVDRDSQGQPWPPDCSHEALAAIQIVKGLWHAFEKDEAFFAVVANLHNPSADLVIISQRGIGIVELKHSFGRITQRENGHWYAGPKHCIKAGSENRNFQNPHEQVQAYAQDIRTKLMFTDWDEPYLPGLRTQWVDYKFQVAVCFSHPDAEIESLKASVRRYPCPALRDWEEFTVLKPYEIPEWAAALRFRASMDHQHNFEPYYLTPQQVLRIATSLLRGTEWTEIMELMPTGEPYAYLTLLEGEQRLQVFGLDREEVCIGRDANCCSVTVPEYFSFVSRHHARVFRTVEGIFVKDLGSRNGTFIDGKQIPKGEKRNLEYGQRIILGAPGPDELSPALVFTKVVISPPTKRRVA